MRLFAFFLCLAAASCGNGNTTSSPQAEALNAAPLTESECAQLIKREYDNLPISGSPMGLKFLESCKRGSGIYHRAYFNCVFASRYVQAIDCAYEMKGIDRSKRETGEHGRYSGTAASAVAVLYKDVEYRSVIDKYALKSYLDQRDRAFTVVDEVPPSDRESPRYERSYSTQEGSRTFWIVEIGYVDLQLAQILAEDANGIHQVHCAILGPDIKLSLDSGLCSRLIEKHHGVSISR